MANEYGNVTNGRMFANDYRELTGGYAKSDVADTNMETDLMGVNVSEAGLVKIRTDRGTIVTIHVNTGDVGTAPISQIYVTGTTATIEAGII